MCWVRNRCNVLSYSIHHIASLLLIISWSKVFHSRYTDGCMFVYKRGNLYHTFLSTIFGIQGNICS